MLKRVPVRGGEGWWWPGCGWCSCPVAGTATSPECPVWAVSRPRLRRPDRGLETAPAEGHA